MVKVTKISNGDYPTGATWMANPTMNLRQNGLNLQRQLIDKKK